MNYQQCPICNKEFKVNSSKKRHYCSVVCMKEGFKTQLKGENNPNYRHGPIQKYCEICGVEISKNAKSRCVKCNTKSGEANPFFGKTHSDETKKHFSEIRKGKDLGHNKGKKYTEERKRKMSETTRKKWLTLTDEEKKIRTDALLKGVLSQLSHSETKPEKEVRGILDEHNIHYEKNKKLYDKFFVDFYIGDGKIIIEVFGDYWHCNPDVFSTPNNHQIKQTSKDKTRLAYLKKCGHEVIVIWENELKTKKHEVVGKLRKLLGVDNE